MLLCLMVFGATPMQASTARTESVKWGSVKRKAIRHFFKKQILGKLNAPNACVTLMLKDSTELTVTIQKRKGNRIWYVPCYPSDAGVKTLDRRDLIAARLPDGRLWTQQAKHPLFGSAAPEGIVGFASSLAGVLCFFVAINLEIFLPWLVILSPILAIAGLALGWNGFRKSSMRRFWSIMAMFIGAGIIGLYAYGLLELLFYF